MFYPFDELVLFVWREMSLVASRMVGDDDEASIAADESESPLEIVVAPVDMERDLEQAAESPSDPVVAPDPWAPDQNPTSVSTGTVH